MIKSLRGRLILVMMTLLTVVMVVVAILFLSFTYSGMEADSLIALEEAGKRYGIHQVHAPGEEPLPDKGGHEEEKPDRDPPGDKLPEDGGPGKKDDDRVPQSVIPCFVVGYDHEGALYAQGPRYYDLEDTAWLEQLLDEARAQGETHGLLGEHNLRFLRLDEVCGDAYAFTDVTSEQDAMTRFLGQTGMIVLLALLGLFVISLMVSKWATRPTELMMEQQRQFVADASHELKTPLTVILTNAELLEDSACSMEEKQKATGHILTMARQMRGLVEELLDLARVNGGIRSELKAAVDLSRQAEDMVLLFEPIYFEAGRELQSQIDNGITVLGIPDRLGQVVEILLDNGCKYSGEGTVVTLRLRRLCLKKCLLTVESRGDTLTAQECRDIFRRFYRRESHRSMTRSYGLGLSIARNILRQHKGKIWVESKEGVNTFYVTLPTVQGKG